MLWETNERTKQISSLWSFRPKLSKLLETTRALRSFQVISKLLEAFKAHRSSPEKMFSQLKTWGNFYRDEISLQRTKLIERFSTPAKRPKWKLDEIYFMSNNNELIYFFLECELIHSLLQSFSFAIGLLLSRNKNIFNAKTRNGKKVK